MTGHRLRRSWWRLGAWRCVCGRKPGHGLVEARAVGSPLPDGDVVALAGYRRHAEVLSAPRNGGSWRAVKPDVAGAGEIKAQIQVLAEEIAVLRALDPADPRGATADRIVAVKVGMIRSLRALLPAIPAGHPGVRWQPRNGAGAATVPIAAGGVEAA